MVNKEEEKRRKQCYNRTNNKEIKMKEKIGGGTLISILFVSFIHLSPLLFFCTIVDNVLLPISDP